MRWYDVVSIALAFGAIGWLGWFIGRKDRDRDRLDEDAARAHFDRYGRWPDEERPRRR